MAQPIENHGIIGGCETVVLAGRSGSIEWLRRPNFASGTCFAVTLGHEGYERRRLAPAAAVKEGRWSTPWQYDTLMFQTK